MGFRDISKEISDVAADYHFTKPPAMVEDLVTFLARVLRGALEWLRDVFQHSGGVMDSRGMSFLLQLGLYIIAGAGLVWLVIVLVKRAQTAEAANARGTKGATTVEEILDGEGWQRQAEKLAATKDYKGACRALYLSLLQKLDENGIAQFAPTKTNYEYSYSLAKFPEIQREFKELANRVEVIWFGNKEADADDFDQSRNQLQGMDPQIRRIGAEKQLQQVKR